MQPLGEINSNGDAFKITLEYPTLPVQGTPARWLARSQLVPMASHTNDDSSADEATSSLGDSSYDFIDDGNVMTTDDESQDGMTESVASSDGFEIGCGREESLDAMGHEEKEAHSNSQADARQDLLSSLRSPETPILKPQDGVFNLQTPHEQIAFRELDVSPGTSLQSLEVSFELGCIPNDDNIITKPPSKSLAASVCQTMASQYLHLGHESYRVLYVGDSLQREPIIQKIASALAATPQRSTLSSSNSRTAKFNVIPISSFGDQTNPEVILVGSSGVELEFEECKQTVFLETPDGTEILQITLADGSTVSSARQGKTFKTLENWKLPNIAVFSIAEKDDHRAKRDRRLAQMFMNRHSVPSVIIKALPEWRSFTESMTLDHRTPHVCLKGQVPDACKSNVLKRLPIDLDTFLKIDAGQMNRNLACLADNTRNANEEYASKAGSRADQKCSDRISTYCPPLLLFYFQILRQTLHQHWAPLFGLILIVFCAVNAATMCGSRVSKYDGPAAHRNGTMLSSPSEPAAFITTPSSHSSFVRSSSNMLTSVPHESAEQQHPGTDITSLILNPTFQSHNRSEKFQAHILGDCHIVMMPPYWFAKLRKAPTLSYKVTRKSITLSHKHMILFNGVNALQIPREEAYGVLDVEVWTKLRPFVHQNFEVDFGSYWLKVAAWKRATRTFGESVQMEFSQVRSSLMTVLDKSKKELSTVIRMNKQVIIRRPNLQKVTITRRWKQGKKTTDVILAQTRDIARRLSCRLCDGRSAAASNMVQLRNTIASKLDFFTRNRSASLLENVKTLRTAAANVKPTAMFQGFRDWRSTRALGVQKMALKTWWKVKGLPKSMTPQLKDTDASRSDGIPQSE